MIIFGIDPGTEICGWCRLALDGNPDPVGFESGIFKPKGGTREGRLRSLYWHLEKLVEKYQPDEIAIEDGIVWRSNDATLALAEARGVCVVATLGRPFFRYNPSTIKKCMTGNGRASKELVARMVEQRFGMTFTPSFDQADAIATAVAHAERRKW